MTRDKRQETRDKRHRHTVPREKRRATEREYLVGPGENARELLLENLLLSVGILKQRHMRVLVQVHCTNCRHTPPHTPPASSSSPCPTAACAALTYIYIYMHTFSSSFCCCRCTHARALSLLARARALSLPLSLYTADYAADVPRLLLLPLPRSCLRCSHRYIYMCEYILKLACGVCACVRERECVCVCERERERVCMHVSMYVCMNECTNV